MSKTATKAIKAKIMADVAELQSLPAVSLEELAKHNKPDDAWVMVDGVVYDVTKFAKLHPGGRAVLLRAAGTDATADFKMVHGDTVLQKYANLRVGRLALEEMDPAEVKKLMKVKATEAWLPLSGPYFNDIRGTLKSPHFTEKHFAFQKKVRELVATKIKPFADKWDEKGEYPLSLHEEWYKTGLYAAAWPEKYGGTPPEGGWDIWMDFIKIYEMAQIGCQGLTASWLFTMSIGLPPVLNHGSEHMKQTAGREVITGKKIIALAITEPWGGSDVAQVRTTAVSDGDFYIVTGEKKFITSGMTAHYVTTAVRTDPTKKGMDGISLLLIPGDAPGIVRTKIKTQGWWAGNTALINFESVRVPKANLIGKEHHGFRYIMENFNHERFSAIVQCTAGCQLMIGECIKYARNRYTFGQPLIKSQVIRHKIASMAMKAEACFAMSEQLAYHLSINVPHIDLGPRIALAKVFCTQSFEYCAREASQIFGGNSYMRTGPGAKIERYYRDVRAMAISGGSEEIMFELATRGSKL